VPVSSWLHGLQLAFFCAVLFVQTACLEGFERLVTTVSYDPFGHTFQVKRLLVNIEPSFFQCDDAPSCRAAIDRALKLAPETSSLSDRLVSRLLDSGAEDLNIVLIPRGDQLDVEVTYQAAVGTQAAAETMITAEYGGRKGRERYYLVVEAQGSLDPLPVPYEVRKVPTSAAGGVDWREFWVLPPKMLEVTTSMAVEDQPRPLFASIEGLSASLLEGGIVDDVVSVAPAVDLPVLNQTDEDPEPAVAMAPELPEPVQVPVLEPEGVESPGAAPAPAPAPVVEEAPLVPEPAPRPPSETVSPREVPERVEPVEVAPAPSEPVALAVDDPPAARPLPAPSPPEMPVVAAEAPDEDPVEDPAPVDPVDVPRAADPEPPPPPPPERIERVGEPSAPMPVRFWPEPDPHSPAKVYVFEPRVTGSLSVGAATASSNRLVPRAEVCYQKRVVDDASVAGTLFLNAIVREDGFVVSLTVYGELRDLALRRCLETAIEDWAFEPYGSGEGVSDVSLPLTMRVEELSRTKKGKKARPSR